jgi:polyribonucleotide nucleotidyltransferase
MATVCAGCLALQDAGVPVTRPVAGVAMGLVLPEAPGQSAIVLTDILGSEDALGDMDFKVAGDADGITAFQMDIKVEGITLDILKQALTAAQVGRTHILQRMAAASPAPRNSLSAFAPRVGRTRIDPAKAGMVIGSGGKNIRSICDATGATDIQIDEAGVVTITAPSQAALDGALAIVRGTCVELEVGTVYRGVAVLSLTDFGAFVELAPGKTGLLHVSELALTRVEAVSDVVKPGDLVDVKLLEINARGQMRLSRRAVLELDGGIAPSPPAPATPPPPRREPRVVVTKAAK